MVQSVDRHIANTLNKVFAAETPVMAPHKAPALLAACATCSTSAAPDDLATQTRTWQQGSIFSVLFRWAQVVKLPDFGALPESMATVTLHNIVTHGGRFPGAHPLTLQARWVIAGKLRTGPGPTCSCHHRNRMPPTSSMRTIAYEIIERLAYISRTIVAQPSMFAG